MLTSFTDVQDTLNLDEDVLIYRSNYIGVRKRLFDLLVAALITILVLSWLIPIIGLLIKLTSPGPIIFIQWRTGLNKRPFRCFKFRTMVYNHASTTFKQTAFKDSRITPIGHWLRKTNLDEMPQFLNVLLGDMSVVGPRPHAIQHDAEFWFTLPDYHKRYTIRPGITGLAQINGARGITDDTSKMKHRLQYDLSYINNSSLRLDTQICWSTATSMFRGDPNAW